MRKSLLLAAAVASLATACTSTPGPGGVQKVVLQVARGIRSAGNAPVYGILDLGLPPIHNLSGSTVRLRSVQLVSPSAALRVRNIRAYLWRQVGAGWVTATFGDLPKECPRQFTPYPVTAVVTAPRSDSRWMVIIALTISRPGTYHVRKVKISYIAGGQPGWQYQNLDDVITASPRFHPPAGC